MFANPFSVALKTYLENPVNVALQKDNENIFSFENKCVQNSKLYCGTCLEILLG